MKTAPIIAVALLALLGSPVAASTLKISVPLVSFDSPTPDVSDATLRGTLTYDNDANTGSGSFEVAGFMDFYSGFAATSALFDLSQNPTSLGVSFFGEADDGAALSFSVNVANDAGTIDVSDGAGTVLLYAPGFTGAYTSLAGSILPADAVDPGPGSGSGAPGGAVSAVPLPGAAPLFGGALLALAGSRLRRVAAVVRPGSGAATVRRAS